MLSAFFNYHDLFVASLILPYGFFIVCIVKAVTNTSLLLHIYNIICNNIYIYIYIYILYIQYTHNICIHVYWTVRTYNICMLGSLGCSVTFGWTQAPE